MNYSKFKLLFVCSVLVFFSFSFVVLILSKWKIAKHNPEIEFYYGWLPTFQTEGPKVDPPSTTRFPTSKHTMTTTSQERTATSRRTTEREVSTVALKEQTRESEPEDAATTPTHETVDAFTKTKHTMTTTAKATTRRTTTITTEVATTKEQLTENYLHTREVVKTPATTEEASTMLKTSTTQMTTTQPVTSSAATTRKDTTPVDSTVTEQSTTSEHTTQTQAATEPSTLPTTLQATLAESTAVIRTTATTTTATTEEPWAVKYYKLGCYSALATVSDYKSLVTNLRDFIDWSNMTKTVVECASFLQRPNTLRHYGKLLRYFAIKFYGECWADESAASVYYSRGKSTDCYQDAGGDLSIYAYHFGPAERPPEKNMVYVGCYMDGLKLPIKHKIGIFPVSGASSDAEGERVSKECYKLAWERGYSVFGIKNKGECWSGPDAHLTYDNSGTATDCVYGLGSTFSFSIYRLEP